MGPNLEELGELLSDWQAGRIALWSDPFADIEQTATSLMTLTHERYGEVERSHVAHELARRLVAARYAFNQSMDHGYHQLKRLLDEDPLGDDPTGGLSNLSVFYAEACYAQLFRIVERASRGKKPWSAAMPSLRGFEPRGVVLARNQNFEHAPHDETELASFFVGSGVQLLPSTPSGDWVDPGLAQNTGEFTSDLHDRLTLAVAAIA